MVCSRKAAVETPVSLAHLYSDSLLSKKSSKRGLTRRPLFLVRVESLVCTVEMIGPSRSAGAGRDALPRVRRCTSRRSFCCFCERALTLSELRLFPYPVFPFAPSLDVRRRVARERVPTSRNGVG